MKVLIAFSLMVLLSACGNNERTERLEQRIEELEAEKKLQQQEKEKAEEVRRERAARREKVNQLYKVTVDTNADFLPFGGTRSVSVVLNNNSSLTFNSVRVAVYHWLANGGLYSTDYVEFRGVEQRQNYYQYAPTQNRGSRVTAEITGYDSPDLQ